MTADSNLPNYNFFPDYTAEFPFWLEGYIADPATELGLPEYLLDQLRSWVNDWEAGCPAEKGWIDEATRSRWLKRGDELFAVVVAELEGRATVSPKFRWVC